MSRDTSDTLASRRPYSWYAAITPERAIIGLALIAGLAYAANLGLSQLLEASNQVTQFGHKAPEMANQIDKLKNDFDSFGSMGRVQSDTIRQLQDDVKLAENANRRLEVQMLGLQTQLFEKDAALAKAQSSMEALEKRLQTNSEYSLQLLAQLKEESNSRRERESQIAGQLKELKDFQLAAEDNRLRERKVAETSAVYSKNDTMVPILQSPGIPSYTTPVLTPPVYTTVLPGTTIFAPESYPMPIYSFPLNSAPLPVR